MLRVSSGGHSRALETLVPPWREKIRQKIRFFFFFFYFFLVFFSFQCVYLFSLKYSSRFTSKCALNNYSTSYMAEKRLWQQLKFKIFRLTSIWYQTNIMFGCQFHNLYYVIMTVCKDTVKQGIKQNYYRTKNYIFCLFLFLSNYKFICNVGEKRKQ